MSNKNSNKTNNNNNKEYLTTSTGCPVDNNQNSITIGSNGPILLQDFHLIDKLASFDRERIPERVVHAKGAGAHGYFEVTSSEIRKYCKADLFSEVGKKTPVFVRFSTVGGEKGSADTERDPRGFAIKFYTNEGNWDMVGNNTPVFFIRDALKFPDFIHTQKRNPVTNCKDPDMFWDFLSLTPESNHQVTILFSDRGTPDGYRHMNGYSSHTFKYVNNFDKAYYVKMHFKTNQGIKNLSADESNKLKSEDPDYATRDLFENIKKGNYPSWCFKVQVMPVEDADKYEWNVLDITKVWPHRDYPLIEVGKLVLNKNPVNYHAEVEQSAFSPSHLIPGIEATNDKMLQGRLFSYPDTHRHRLGGNYNQIPINCPYKARSLKNNHRDGYNNMVFKESDSINYEPNSFQDIKGYKNNDNQKGKLSSFKIEGVVGRHNYTHSNDDYRQAGNLFSRVMNEEQRINLINNIAAHLGNAKQFIQERQCKIFYKCHPEYGLRLAEKLKLNKGIFSKF